MARFQPHPPEWSPDLEGREKYFDAPDDTRPAVLQAACARVDSCKNGEDPGFYRGVIAEASAQRSGHVRKCGKSAPLCFFHECACSKKPSAAAAARTRARAK